MTDHRPETWYWEAGSEHCPHGPEPASDSADWETWAARHSGSPQDVFICLDAPIGECCKACSEETGEAVGWKWCEEREGAAAEVQR